jgi:hypothetical protein
MATAWTLTRAHHDNQEEARSHQEKDEVLPTSTTWEEEEVLPGRKKKYYLGGRRSMTKHVTGRHKRLEKGSHASVEDRGRNISLEGRGENILKAAEARGGGSERSHVWSDTSLGVRGSITSLQSDYGTTPNIHDYGTTPNTNASSKWWSPGT